MLGQCLHGLALPVRRRTHVQDDSLVANSFHYPRFARADHAVGDALYTKPEGVLDVGGIASLARVAGQMEPGRAGRRESRGVRRRGVENLVAREVEADHFPCEAAGDLRQLDVLVGRVLPHRADDGHRLDRSGLEAGQHCLDHPLHGQPAAQVQSRCPPHLEVVDVFGSGVLAQLPRDALESGFGLHHRDRVVEVRDVLGLAVTVVGRDHPKALPSGQVLRRGQAYCSIQVRVQLGFLPAEESRLYVRA